MMNNTKNALLGTSLIAVAALALSSCGKSDSKGGAEASPSASAAPAAPAGDLEEIKPCLTSRSPMIPS